MLSHEDGIKPQGFGYTRKFPVNGNACACAHPERHCGMSGETQLVPVWPHVQHISPPMESVPSSLNLRERSWIVRDNLERLSQFDCLQVRDEEKGTSIEQGSGHLSNMLSPVSFGEQFGYDETGIKIGTD